MITTFIYISGFLTGIFFLSMLRYRSLYKGFKYNKSELESENESLKSELSELLEDKKSKVRKGIIKHSTTVNNHDTGSTKKVFWTLEIEEVEKTNDKSKINILSVKADDVNEKVDSRRKKRIMELVGDWIPTHEIEWIVNKTSQEVRTDKIDNILNED